MEVKPITINEIYDILSEYYKINKETVTRYINYKSFIQNDISAFGSTKKNNTNLGNELGDGTYGSVHLSKKNNNKIYKKFHMRNNDSYSPENRVYFQSHLFEILSTLLFCYFNYSFFPNRIENFGVFRNESYFYKQEKLNPIGNITLDANLFGQIAGALYILDKKCNFRHRDFHAQNAMVKELRDSIENTYVVDNNIVKIKCIGNQAKLIDLGTICFTSDDINISSPYFPSRFYKCNAPPIDLFFFCLDSVLYETIYPQVKHWINNRLMVFVEYIYEEVRKNEDSILDRVFRGKESDKYYFINNCNDIINQNIDYETIQRHILVEYIGNSMIYIQREQHQPDDKFYFFTPEKFLNDLNSRFDSKVSIIPSNNKIYNEGKTMNRLFQGGTKKSKSKNNKPVKKSKSKKGGQEISQEEKMQNILNFVEFYKGNELFEEQLMENLREDSNKTNRYYKKIAEVEEIVGYLQSQNKLSNRQQNYLIEKLLNNDKMRKKYYNIITSNYPR